MSYFFTLARSSRRGRAWIFRYLFLCFTTMVPASLVGASEVTLSLAEAQRIAVLRSPQLAAQASAITSARELAVATQQLPDPILKFGIENLPIEGEDRLSLTRDFMTMRRIGVMQEFTRADKRQFRGERIDREGDKLAAEQRLSLAAIQRDTALAWLERYYAEAMATALAEQYTQAKFELKAAESAYRGGRGELTDVLVARSALLMFDDKTSELQRRTSNATTMLARWVGELATRPLGVKPNIELLRFDLSALDSELRHHPQIQVLTQEEAIAAADVRLAEANRKSDWSGEIAFSQRGPLYSNMISAGVSIPLQLNRKNKQDRELASKLATLEQVKALREEALRSHSAEVRALVTEWQSGQARLVRYQREWIPLASDATNAAVAAYRGGKAKLIQVFSARRSEIEVRTQALQLESDTARLWAQLNFLFPEDQPAHFIHDSNRETP